MTLVEVPASRVGIDAPLLTLVCAGCGSELMLDRSFRSEMVEALDRLHDCPQRELPGCSGYRRLRRKGRG